MVRVWHALRGLPAQMVLTSIALVFVTAAAAGLPAVWLVRGQAQLQAWASVRQGLRATEALYAADVRELAALATLTAQRPTLRSLVAAGDERETWEYLEELRGGADLDSVTVCDSLGQVVASSVAGAPPTAGGLDAAVCAVGRAAGHIVTDDWPHVGEATPTGSEVWLLAGHYMSGPGGLPGGAVVVGSRLTDRFTKTLVEKTGLEQTVLVGGDVAATSLPGQPRTLTPNEDDTRLPDSGRLVVGGRPHYYGRLPLAAIVPGISDSGDGVGIEVALPVADLAAAEQRMLQVVAGAIALVAAVGSVLAALLSRRVSRPLESLVAAAEGFRGGDLASAVPDVGDVREVSLVARALEEARQGLRRSLDELREEKVWTDQLLDAIVEGIVTLDAEGYITYFSSGAERILGWRRGQAIGRLCDEVFRPAETDVPFTELMPLPGRRVNITVALPGGRRAALAVTGAHLIPPEQSGDRVALVFRDVTDSESMHRVMGHFLANVSHEFLTPLTALAASAELLRDQAPDLSRDEMQELLFALHVSILKLHTLVDNLLEGASIEAGRFDVSARPVPLDEIVAEAVTTMRPLLDRHGQRLAMDLPPQAPVVLADRRRTTQVVVNLLSNASRYGPDDSDIELGATYTGTHVRVHVSDRGPGVPPAQRDNVFHRFVYRGADADRSRFGAGLGLSVVKAIVESQGGTVGVEPRAGGGSEFWFTVPVRGDV